MRATASVRIAERRRAWCRAAGGAIVRPARPSISRVPIRSSSCWRFQASAACSAARRALRRPCGRRWPASPSPARFHVAQGSGRLSLCARRSEGKNRCREFLGYLVRAVPRDGTPTSSEWPRSSRESLTSFFLLRIAMKTKLSCRPTCRKKKPRTTVVFADGLDTLLSSTLSHRCHSGSSGKDCLSRGRIQDPDDVEAELSNAVHNALAAQKEHAQNSAHGAKSAL